MTWGGPAQQQFTQGLTNASNAQSWGPSTPKPTAFDGYLQQGLAYNQPALLQSQLGMDSGVRSFWQGQQGYGLDQTGLQNSYTSNSRDLALQQGQNGIDLRAAQRQPQLLAQLLGLDNQEYDLQRGDAGNRYQQNLTGINSDATARGAFGASGVNQQRAYNYTDLAQQMGHIDVAQQKNTLSASEQKQQATDRIDALNMTAGRLGMKGDELRSTLDNQLAKLGLNHAVSTDDILDGISRNDLQSKQILMSIVQQAGQYATAGKGQ